MMKFNEKHNPSILLNYGFEEINEDWKIQEGVDEYDLLYDYNGNYIYDLGLSRRGQFYYLIFNGIEFEIYATKPDGDGGTIVVNDIFLKLIKDDIVI